MVPIVLPFYVQLPHLCWRLPVDLLIYGYGLSSATPTAWTYNHRVYLMLTTNTGLLEAAEIINGIGCWQTAQSWLSFHWFTISCSVRANRDPLWFAQKWKWWKCTLCVVGMHIDTHQEFMPWPLFWPDFMCLWQPHTKSEMIAESAWVFFCPIWLLQAQVLQLHEQMWIQIQTTGGVKVDFNNDILLAPFLLSKLKQWQSKL